MSLATKIALAAVLTATAAAPAAADAWWAYRGGPKGPPSLTGPDYASDDAYYGGPHGTPGYGYGGPYAYVGSDYGYGPRMNEPLYRCSGPATSDCYSSRALQGTR